MSIEQAFDDKSKEVISPNSMIEKLENPPQIAVVTFRQIIVDTLLKNYEAKIITYYLSGDSIPVYEINYKGTRIAFYKTVIGAPSTVGVLEELHAMGIKNFLFYGECGCLSKNILEHNIIIPTEAYRDEGTSYHYMGKSDYVEIDTYKKLEEIFKYLNIPYTLGKTWTTDALYRETRNNIQKRKEEGCICVDMECSAIMAVAKFRGIKAYQFFYAADNLDANEWDRRVLGLTDEEQRLNLLNIALEVAKNII